jgi:hypothetical protein
MRNVKGTAVAMLVAVTLTSGPISAQQCLQEAPQSADQRARREAAVRFVERVNAVQTLSQRDRGTYTPLEASRELRDVPVGFVPRLVFNQWNYVISMKDLFDPCGFSLFSDEHGVIYEAHARVVARSSSLPAAQVRESTAQ